MTGGACSIAITVKVRGFLMLHIDWVTRDYLIGLIVQVDQL